MRFKLSGLFECKPRGARGVQKLNSTGTLIQRTTMEVSGLLLETGVSHNKQRLHKANYFRKLPTTNKEVDDSIRPLLKLSRESTERLQKTD